MRILLIEDDVDLAAGAYDYLETDGFIVDSALDGEAGLHLATNQKFDAIVLDLKLPGMDGLTLCRELQRQDGSNTPIIMATARDTLDDKLQGFEAGADDYLIKPFSLQELAARLQALGRRRSASSHGVGIYRVADLMLNTQMHEVSRAGQTINLTPTTMRLLEVLMRNAPAVVTRADIEQLLWGDYLPDSDALRAHIHVLRAAIDTPFEQKLLHTVRGVGYRISNVE